ncbi:MAG TPA: hypothetical protein DCM28_06550 [Phycisphaerales bacterium]|nr:hypothetical protein [Phycisphaerales bacterium]HCD34737.1 hypothetical protein [Phycisphaerales bacterium]|tara:strand:+ start:509 stop:1357 length:849 start_codon:yes stop_codon:yes gene_type:complete
MGDTFHIHCEICDTKLRVSEDSRGLAVRCPHCEHVQHVPTLNEESMADTAVENPTSADFAENLSELTDDDDIFCPSCEGIIHAGNTVCDNCGFNTETGMTFSQGAAAYKRPRRPVPMPAFVSVIFGAMADVIRVITPRGVHPTVTGTGMFVIMLLLIGGGGFLLSNSITGKEKHLRIRIVEELEIHLNEQYPNQINPDHIRVVDPINIKLFKATGIQDRVHYTGKLSIVTNGQRRIVGEVEGVFDSGLLFYGLELSTTVLTTEFNLFPDFLDTLTRVQTAPR